MSSQATAEDVFKKNNVGVHKQFGCKELPRSDKVKIRV
jgi:hypothetical protein